MDTSIIFFFAAILIVAGLLFAVITMTKKGTSRLDIDKYRLRWLKIEQQLKRDEVTSYHITVLEADKLLDLALRERGAKGETMGERMKTMKETWLRPIHSEAKIDLFLLHHKLNESLTKEEKEKLAHHQIEDDPQETKVEKKEKVKERTKERVKEREMIDKAANIENHKPNPH